MKLIEATTNIGEILVLIGAALWLPVPVAGRWVFASGTLLFALGRIMMKHESHGDITLRRLHVQRYIGVGMLVGAALIMFFNKYLDGVEVADYVVRATPAAWLLPFVIFVVIELYTAFRIPAQEKKVGGMKD